MATPPRYVELRFDIPAELAVKIDALLMVDRHQARRDYLLPLIQKAVDAEFHRSTVLLRCAGINPLDSTCSGRVDQSAS